MVTTSSGLDGRAAVVPGTPRAAWSYVDKGLDTPVFAVLPTGENQDELVRAAALDG